MHFDRSLRSAISPVVGGPVHRGEEGAVPKLAPAYVIAVVVYVMIIFSTVRIDFKSAKPSGPRPSFVSELVEGFRYLAFDNRTALMLVVLAAGPLAFAFSYLTLLPVYVTEALGGGSSGFGLIQSISAIGALIGGFTLASLRDVPHKGRIMMISGLSYGALVMVLGSIGLAYDPVAAYLDFALISTFQLWQRMAYRLCAALQS